MLRFGTGYHSKRYHDEQQRERHYSSGEVEESRFDEREFSDDQADDYDDELYPTARRMQQPERQVARLEQNTPPQYPTYHQTTHSQTAISREDRNRESKKSIPPPPPQESPSQQLVINYDTLNDPSSFLYSKNEKMDKRSTKPKLVNINFEKPENQTPPAKEQTTARTESTGLNEERSGPQPQAAMTHGATVNTAAPANTESHQNATTASSSVPVEPTYSVIDRNRKEGRRRAPPPPTSRK